MQKLIDKPIPPDSNDCCGNGCSPCVWDLYYEELERWRQQEEQRQQQTAPQPASKD
jgi:hypothetical protein